MRILVIDDAEYNRASAVETLKGHDLTVVGTVEEAYRIINKENFDAVFTDLWMPTPEGKLYTDVCMDYMNTVYNTSRAIDTGVGKEVPAGLIFAIKARNKGVKYVAILTDGNHHNDRLCAIMDLINGGSSGYHEGYIIGGVHKYEARYYCLSFLDIETGKKLDEDSGEWWCRPIKDWGKLLQTIKEKDKYMRRMQRKAKAKK